MGRRSRCQLNARDVTGVRRSFRCIRTIVVGLTTINNGDVGTGRSAEARGHPRERREAADTIDTIFFSRGAKINARSPFSARSREGYLPSFFFLFSSAAKGEQDA